MKTNLNPNKIAQLLTQSTRQLDESTLTALAQARQNALQRQAVRASVFALNTGGETDSLIPDWIQQWVIAGLLVAILIAGTSFWHHVQEQQTAELDVAILTDELPIEAYVD
jgi:Protein of unknown function (DUF3619)